MPLLYREDDHITFQRLQQEILKISADELIFAWSGEPHLTYFEMSSPRKGPGMLANSVKDFEDSGNIVAYPFDL
jgi:hypothetical protein